VHVRPLPGRGLGGGGHSEDSHILEGSSAGISPSCASALPPASGNGYTVGGSGAGGGLLDGQALEGGGDEDAGGGGGVFSVGGGGGEGGVGGVGGEGGEGEGGLLTERNGGDKRAVRGRGRKGWWSKECSQQQQQQQQQQHMQGGHQSALLGYTQCIQGGGQEGGPGTPTVLSWENLMCRVGLPQGGTRYVLQVCVCVCLGVCLDEEGCRKGAHATCCRCVCVYVCVCLGVCLDEEGVYGCTFVFSCRGLIAWLLVYERTTDVL